MDPGRSIQLIQIESLVHCIYVKVIIVHFAARKQVIRNLSAKGGKNYRTTSADNNTPTELSILGHFL